LNKLKSIPACVTVILIPVLMVLVRSVYKLFYIFRNITFITDLLSNFTVWWMFFSAVFWTTISLWLFVNMYKKNALVLKRFKVITILYASFFWFEQFFLFQNPLRKTNWNFLAFASILIIIWMFYVLSNNCTKIFFGEINE